MEYLYSFAVSGCSVIGELWGMHVYLCRWISIFFNLWDFTCLLRTWIISSSESPVLGMEGVELASTGQIGGVVQERVEPQNCPVDVLNQCNPQVIWAMPTLLFLGFCIFSVKPGSKKRPHCILREVHPWQQPDIPDSDTWILPASWSCEQEGWQQRSCADTDPTSPSYRWFWATNAVLCPVLGSAAGWLYLWNLPRSLHTVRLQASSI